MTKLDLYQGIVLKYISLLFIMSKYLIHVPLLYSYMGIYDTQGLVTFSGEGG